ncbi:YoaK family protein [Enterococcus sp. LJL120]
MMNKDVSPHETLKIGALLAVTAGILDAYTYLVHGEVFAGLQTGNLILMGIHILNSNFADLVHYLIPLFAFMLGVILTRLFQQRYAEHHDESLRPICLMIFEIILIILTAFLSPYLSDRLASALISITAAIQLQEFRKLKGAPFTSLMMTGNIRTLAESFYDGITQKNKKALEKGCDILVIILSFFLGAVFTSLLVPILNEKAVLLAAVTLLIGIFILLRVRSNQKLKNIVPKV